MGVCIKGMEMPKCCDKCPFKTYVGVDLLGCKITGYMFYVWDVGFGDKPYTRHESCPLIEVPEPHGRLIDADALHYSRIRIAHNDGTIGGYNAVVMSAEIKDAPTIIPASPEGN